MHSYKYTEMFLVLSFIFYSTVCHCVAYLTCPLYRDRHISFQFLVLLQWLKLHTPHFVKEYRCASRIFFLKRGYWVRKRCICNFDRYFQITLPISCITYILTNNIWECFYASLQREVTNFGWFINLGSQYIYDIKFSIPRTWNSYLSVQVFSFFFF